MKNLIIPVLLSVFFILGISSVLYSQSENIYDTGTVWSLSFIRTGANAEDLYLKGIKNTWESQMKEAIKEGLIKSYKILLGPASNKEDFNIILMIEFNNMAALDFDSVIAAKWAEIDRKVKENMKGGYDQTVSNYENIRQHFGEKYMREIQLK